LKTTPSSPALNDSKPKLGQMDTQDLDSSWDEVEEEEEEEEDEIMEYSLERGKRAEDEDGGGEVK